MRSWFDRFLFAAALAAGVVALILSVNPEVTMSEARMLLSTTCDTVGGYDYSAIEAHGPWSSEMGYGRVNAFRAVEKAATFEPAGIGDANERGGELRAWPNPSGGALEISFDLSGHADVHIALLDARGTRLWERSYHRLAAGSHVLELAGATDGLPAGLYFITFKAGHETFTAKWLLH